MNNIVQGKGKEKNKNRDFAAEVEEKIYYTDDGKVGFPASGFKKAIVEVAPYLDGADKKLVKGSLQIVGNLVPLKFKTRVINKSTCIPQRGGAPMEVWRPEFRDWTAKLDIRYNASQITPNQIVELAKLAGFHIGVGAWTPQHNGSFGMFTVA